MKEHVFQSLQNNCSALNDAFNNQFMGNLGEETQFLCQSFLVNTGHPELAIEFTKANPNCDDAALDKLDKFIASSQGQNIGPTRCIKFGCDETQIAKCHPKLLTTAEGEASNSPAFFISEKALAKYQSVEDFNAIKDGVFEKIAAGDKSAHLEAAFIQAASQIKAEDAIAYNKLRDELMALKVKIAAFDEEVGKLAKNLATQTTNEAIASIELPDNLKPYAANLDPSVSFLDEQGHIYTWVQDKDGQSAVQVSNFVARITEVREFDDGQEVQNQFVIKGILDGKTPLPQVTIPAIEFKGMRWVPKYWGNVIITSAPKAQDIVRETIQRTSMDAPKVRVHYTLGWKQINDNWCYLYSGGSVNGGAVSVADIHELQGYFYNSSYPYSMEKRAEMVEKLLNVADHAITIPLLAHSFLSILIEKLKSEGIEPKYILWLYGVSGSFKTALTLVNMSLFGSFNSPPATFNDTVAAIEKKAYLAKDCIILIDDYFPASSAPEARTKASVANNVIRKYGDRITRGRSTSNLTLAKEYPPRGNLIATSEDLLIGYSTNSRILCIEVHRGDIIPDKLTELQNNKEVLSAFMVGFIEYIADTVMNVEGVTFKEKFLALRDKSQDSNHHKRFAESIACLQIGWEAFLDYMKHIGHIDDAKYQAYCEEGFQIFQDLAKKQNALVQNDDIADKFMTALKELIDTKVIAPVNKDLPSTLNKGAVVCYEDADYYYFIPQSTYAMVADFFMKKGDLLNINEYMLRKMLADKKYLIESSDGDGHITTKIKIGLASIRVLKIAKSVMNTF